MRTPIRAGHPLISRTSRKRGRHHLVTHLMLSKMEASLHGVRRWERMSNEIHRNSGTDEPVSARWCMMFSTFGLTNAYGVYQDYYVRFHLSNYPPSTIGWIGAFQVFLRTSWRRRLLPTNSYWPCISIRVFWESLRRDIIRQGEILSHGFRIFVIIPLFVRGDLSVFDKISI